MDWDDLYIEIEERWTVEFADEHGREPTEVERKAFVEDMGPEGLSARVTDHYADLCDKAYDEMKDRDAMGY